MSTLTSFDRDEPTEANDFQAASANLILASYRSLLRRSLLPGVPPGGDTGRLLYQAPFVVLAHDASPDPTFFYANRAAQQLFEMSWSQMVHLPSRLSAEPLERDERQRLLDCVKARGFIDDYAGVRISASGKRFLITGATVWNLPGLEAVTGQAAAFAHWQVLPGHAGRVDAGGLAELTSSSGEERQGMLR